MAVLLAANASFIPTSPLHIAKPELSAVRWGMKELNERLEEYGYGGIELLWSNIFKHCRDLRAASAQEAQILARGVQSGHEGWRGVADPIPADPEQTPLRPAQERESLLVKLGGAVLLPHGAKTLDYLEDLERKLGRPEPMHYVMFPDQQGSIAADKAKTTRFPNSSIQPTADLGACWGSRSIDDFVRAMLVRGYKATLDDFHVSREGKIVKQKLKWRPLANILLKNGLVSEVHVRSGGGFDKVDPNRFALSQQEVKALVENRSLDGTPLGYIAELLIKHNWSDNVVDEITTPDLVAIFGKLTPKLQAELRQHIAAGIKQLLPHVRWESRLTIPSVKAS